MAIFDDYYETGKPEGMGCNEFIYSLPADKFKVTFLPAMTAADDGRLIGMVRVEKRKENHADLPIQRQEAQPGRSAWYVAESLSDMPDMRIDYAQAAASN